MLFDQPGWIVPDWTEEQENEYIEERAAIREFDGGLPRHDAERLARQDLKRVANERGRNNNHNPNR